MFTITIDKIPARNAKPGTNENAVGIVGPRTCTLTAEQIINHPNARRFKMRDDDGEVYYEGYYIPNDNEFEPLDAFGTPNAGCTSMEYWDGQNWILL